MSQFNPTMAETLAYAVVALAEIRRIQMLFDDAFRRCATGVEE